MNPALAESVAAYQNGYRAHREVDGAEFQDFVAHTLWVHCGIAITNFSSRWYQYHIGENLQGFEIKCDAKFRETGNLYIEVAEKARPENPQYVPSGIYRDDSWLFIIGDTGKLWIFSTKHLRNLASDTSFRRVETPTSRGVLLPVGRADAECVRFVVLQQGVTPDA